MGFAQAQLPGALFTTLPDGGTVDQNIYLAKEDVYLNGGPHTANGSLMLDGVYIFQITDPSGKTLLSTTNAADRAVRIDGGRFAGRSDLNGNFLGGPPALYPGVSPHPNALAFNANGGLGCQAFPFDDTPNNGGEYKAWLALYSLEDPDNPGTFVGAGDYATIDQNDPTVLHFSLRWCKTDNFKVKVETTDPDYPVNVLKFYDSNMNGQLDPGELPVTNFGITAKFDDDAELFNLTDAAGAVGFGDIPVGTAYEICEVIPPDQRYVDNGINNASTRWLQTAPGAIGDDDDDCYTGVITGDLDAHFGNIALAKLTGVKFYDTNYNGVWDQGEPTLSGFDVQITYAWPDGITNGVDTVTTGANGVWESPLYPEGTTYTVTEVVPSGWEQTFPANGSYNGIITGPGPTNGAYDVTYTVPDVENLDFGNTATCHLEGYKYFDTNMNGVWDQGEAPIEGVTITVDLTLPDATVAQEILTTDANGFWETANEYPDGTTWTATESFGSNGQWIMVNPANGMLTGTISGSGSPTDNTYELDCGENNFGNILATKISGKKFFDTNHDGIKDVGEPPIEGFKIIVKVTYPNGTVVEYTLYTDANGQYQTPYVPVGSSYEVWEVAPNGDWVQTFPVANGGKYLGTIPVPNPPYTVTTTAPNITGLIFLNYFCVEGDGRTPGFWSNKNGYKTMNDGGTIQPELDMLNALPLKKGNGSDAPTFTTHTQFATWLLNGKAVNMAYMLSVHLAAMSLNIEAGFVDPNQVMYAPGTASADANGYATVGAIVAEAIAALEADGYTPSGDPNRALQTALKNALDAGNNNTNWFCAPITVIVPSPY